MKANQRGNWASLLALSLIAVSTITVAETKLWQPEERLSHKTQDVGRGPGPFGDEYWWANRFLTKYNERMRLQGESVDLVMIGDSITHFWEWLNPEGWRDFTKGHRVINLGYGGDRIPQVLWRIDHGELDGYRAKAVALMIGTNNNWDQNSNPTNVAEGVIQILTRIREKQPQAKLILHPIFPRAASPESKHAAAHRRNLITNGILKEYALSHPEITWIDFNSQLVGADGWVPKDIMADELHPTPKGYRVWAEALKPIFEPAAVGKKPRRWQAPLGPDPLPEYEVFVDGRQIELLPVQMKFCEAGSQPTRDWGGVYWAASFAYRPGTEVRVKSLAGPMDEAVLLPKGRVDELKHDGDYEVAFASPKPFRLVLERDKRIKPLLLFGNAVETDLPDFNDPKLIRFKPGKHKVGRLELKDNQTLYLDYGAILYGGVIAAGDNITIRGHGVISGAVYERQRGPCGFPLSGKRCRNLVIRDLTITATWAWTFALMECDGVKVDNIRILGSRMLNDDAIDIINSRNVIIRNSFIRAQDDLIALKGCAWASKEKRPVERILVENCDFWSDRANVFRIGWESDAVGIGKVVARKLEVIHATSEHSPYESDWPHAIFWLEPSGGLREGDMRFEDVNVNLDGYDANLVIANPRVVPWGTPRYTTGGSISNVVFRNISVTGSGLSHCSAFVEGRNANETVSNVTFENVRIFGTLLTEKSPDLKVGKFTSEIKAKP